MEQILKEIGDTYFNLIHLDEKTSTKNLGKWYVRGVKELNEKYNDNPPVFHSDTIEECLSLLLNELKKIRNQI